MDIGTLTGQIQIEDQLSSALTFISSKVNNFASEFETAFGVVAVGAGAAIAAIGLMTGAVTALAVKGADINDVSTTFEHFAAAAGGADAVLKAMRAGTKGTLDDFVLLRAASRLLSAGVELNAKDFGTLTAAAFVLQNRGLGTTKEMLDLVTGAMITGRTRTLAMKLGVIDAGNAEEIFAAKLGVSASQLSEAGKAEAKRQAIMGMLSSVVADAGVQELDFAEKIEKTRASVSNWINELASAVAMSPNVTNAIDTIIGSLSGFGDGKPLIDAVMVGINGFADAVAASVPYVKGFVSVIEGVWSVLKNLVLIVGNVLDRLGLLNPIIEGVKITFGALATMATSVVSAFEWLVKFTDKATGAAKDYTASVQTALPPMQLMASHSSDGAAGLIAAAAAAAGANDRFIDLGKGAETAAKKLHDTNAAIVEARRQISGLPPSMQEAADATKKIVEPLAQLETELQLARKAGIPTSEMLKMFGDNALAAGQKAVAAGESVGALTEKMMRLAAVEDLVAGIDDVADKIEAAFDRIDFSDTVTEMKSAISEMDDALGNMADKAIEEMRRVNEEIDDAFKVPGTAAPWENWAKSTGQIIKENLLGGLKNNLRGLNDIFEAAFTGGGGALGAVKAFASQTLSTVLSLVPGIGPILSQFSGAFIAAFAKIGEAFKRMFGGPSAAELAGRKATDEMTASLGKALSEVQKLEVAQLVAAGNSSKWATQVVAIRDAYVATGHTIDEAMSVVNRLHDAERQGSQAVLAVQNEINDVFTARQAAQDAAAKAAEQQKADQDLLQAAIEKYKFTLEELGPALQRQALHDQALTLLKDWTALVGAGIEMKTVNDHMAESMVDFLNAAIKTGQEIPREMEPMIQQFIDTGTLLGENGEAITDLGQLGLRFSETMSEGFDRVVAKLNDLIVALGGTTSAVEDVGSTSRDVTGQMVLHVQSVTDAVVSGNEVAARSYDHTATSGVTAFGKLKIAATDASNSAKAAADAAIEAWKQLPGYMSYGGGGRSGGEGTSEGRNESDILSGLTEAQAKSVYLGEIANKGSTEQDWERVKPQYGFSRGGTVPSVSYFGSGGVVGSAPRSPFAPSGTDTVAAMLTPGERVMSVPEVVAEKSKPDVSVEVRRELQGLRQDIRNLIVSQPFETARAMRDYLQIGKR